MIHDWPTRWSSERAPADSLRDNFNLIDGWLPSLTFVVAYRDEKHAASVAPLGLVIPRNAGPTADAVGYRLSVLRT
jgi:hypothetical protein